MSKRIVALAAVVPLAVAVAACSSAAMPKPKPKAPKAVATVATPAQATPSPAAAAPTVSSGCVYLENWYNSNWQTWQTISSDLGPLGKDMDNFDTAATALDGQQLGDDVGKLTSIDLTQIPRGMNAASAVELDFAKAKVGLDLIAQFAESGNFNGALNDVGQVTNFLTQANHDMDKCKQVP